MGQELQTLRARKLKEADALLRMHVQLPSVHHDIIMHMLHHIVDSIEELGPPWSHSMWAMEARWRKLGDANNATKYADRSMMLAFRAQCMSCAVMEKQEEAGVIDIDERDRTLERIVIPAWYSSMEGRSKVRLSRQTRDLDAVPPESTLLRRELHLVYMRESEYGAFWQRFVEAKYRQHRAGMPSTAMDQILRTNAWLHWASSLPNASEAELAMAHGPDTHCEVFNRMHYQAVDIMTEASEYASKKAVDSLVLTWFSDGAGHRDPYIGKAQRFLRHIPPWAIGTWEERQAEAMLLVDAKWLQLVGLNDNVYAAPVVTRKYFNEENGNFWRCDLLEPVTIGLGPYYGTGYIGYAQQDLWQVLVRDVDTFKPLML